MRLSLRTAEATQWDLERMTPMAKRRRRVVFSGAVAGSDATVVLLPAAVEDVMGGLDGPVSAVQRE